jgi:hypothetical protein
VQIHQYFAGTIATSDIELRIETEYPWQGSVAVTVVRTGDAPWTLSLRVPGWSAATALVCNGETVGVGAERGYVPMRRTWLAGDRVELELDMSVRLTRAHPRVEACTGQVAIERGPIVYCLEQTDHADANVLDLGLQAAAQLEARWQPDLLGGVMTVEGRGITCETEPALYASWDAPRSASQERSVRAIPYYAWANRSPGAMRVWLPMI